MSVLAQRVLALCLVALGGFLARLHDPRVVVQHGERVAGTPALHFVPDGAGPHPKAVLAHGVSASKETLYRFGEALAAAGIECWAIDLPGHGESTVRFPGDNARVIASVARELGGVDVFLGHSMGAYAGAAAVREAGLSPRLFVAVGALPDLGSRPPPQLLLAGRFEEAVSPARLRSASAATLVLSSWSDHALEPYDPLLIETAVEHATRELGRKKPNPSSRWIWRLLAIPLALAGAISLGLSFSRARGLVLVGSVVLALGLTGSSWLSVVPNLAHLPAQLVAMTLVGSVSHVGARLGLPVWALALPSAGLALECAVLSLWFWWMILTLATVVIGFGVALGVLVQRASTRARADLAIGLLVGYAFGLWLPVF